MFDGAGPGWLEKLQDAGMVIISRQQSVEGMLKVVESMNAEMSGNLYLWDGSKLPF